eukprot:TRINITY_DN2885_c0_g1_i4.p1 TRINITY_DN2885_c0_g1~~TRINITY_DN2885_c0_g1_i4.p1  ORF type:complete len:209 (+),score=39.58 TRINITY_DN2885_c0_g1_i4:190-816(+)
MADTTVDDCKVTDVDECQCQDHCTSPRAVPHLSFGPPHTAPSSPPASPSPRKAYPNFSASLNTYFPGAQRESLFWDCCVEALETHGFKDDNTIACIGVCRDEICGTLMDEVKKRFGDLFIFRGLAGFIFCGKTGLKAAHAHSPICNETGREKYLYVVAAHIGVSADGTLGRVDRRGRGSEASYACGALAYFHSMLVKGQVNLNCNYTG